MRPLTSLVLSLSLLATGCGSLEPTSRTTASAKSSSKPCFRYAADQPPLAGLALDLLVGGAVPTARREWSRPLYYPVYEGQLREFLQQTLALSAAWQSAQPKEDAAELMCTSYSLLFLGLMEQERLKNGCRYPLAMARVKLRSHSLNGFVNEHGELKLVDPFTRSIYTLEEWAKAFPEATIVSILFQ